MKTKLEDATKTLSKELENIVTLPIGEDKLQQTKEKPYEIKKKFEPTYGSLNTQCSRYGPNR